MTLIDLIGSLGYTSPEEHVEMFAYDKNAEDPTQDFIDVELNVSNLARYAFNEVSDICANGDGKLSFLIRNL